MRQGKRRAGPVTLCRTVGLAGVLLLAFPNPGTAQNAWDEPSAASALAARSLVLPGWGQKELGQRRGLAYALAEVTLWTLWAERRHKGSTLRAAYRDLAWREARAQSGSRSDPAWAYFETLSKWTSSGAFDRDPVAGGVQPEENPATFNGSVWSLAVQLYFPTGVAPDPSSPAWTSALAWYADHAYGEAFLWDWSGKEGRFAEYKDLIHRSDDRFGQATTALGALLANHLLSATDAFVSARVPGDAHIRVLPPAPGDVRTGLILTWNPAW